MNSKVLVTTALTAAVFTTGCVQKVKMKVLEPAEVARVANTKVIAVTDFKKDYGVGLSGKIETEISKQILDGKPYFTAVDRTQINKVIREQRFQSSGLMNEDTSVQLGKLIGAQALISGEITSTSASDTSFREKRTKYRNPLKPLETAYIVNVYCKKRVIGMGASIKIVDVKRGDIVYADALTKQRTYKHCNDDSRPLPSKSQGVELLAGQIAKEFVFKLAPHYKTISVELIEDIEFDTGDAQVKALEGALEWIKANRYDKATDILDKLNSSLQGKSYAVIYNLGVVTEAQGQLEDAQKLYQEADALTLAPVDAINNSLRRISDTIAKRKKALAQIAK
jgi:hypothetical protein